MPPKARSHEQRQQLKQPKGNPSLPDTGAVMVDLSKAPDPPPQIVYGKPQPSETPPTIDRSVPVDAIPPQTVDSGGAAPVEAEYDPYQEMKRTTQRVKSRRETSLEADNAQLAAWAAQQANEAAVARHEVTRSNYDTVASALASAEGELQAAKRAYAEAWSKGDGLAVAEATDAMSDARNRINTLRAGKDELEVAVKQPPQVATPPIKSNPNVEAVLAQMPQLNESERDWIRAHPDSIEGRNVDRLRVAYMDSQERGLRRGSREYFDFLNDRLNYTDDADEGDEEPPMEEPVRHSAPPRSNVETLRVSAPPSRTGMGQGSLRPGQVILTEAERQAAKYSNVSEVDYARGKQKLMDAKRQGLYPNG